jgi:AcrR family transcriptional regulator
MAEEPKVRGAGLSREKVLAAALAIADAEGLDALSFRRLAGQLGVTPMALYRYVDDKEALLDGIGDIVLSELELPEPRGDWREQLRAAAWSFRAVLVAHPAVVPIFLRRPLLTPAGLRSANAVVGIFRRAGFSPEQASLPGLHARHARPRHARIGRWPWCGHPRAAARAGTACTHHLRDAPG